MDTLLHAQYALLSVVAHSLVHALWQHALLALLAALSFVLLRKRSAALRHAVGMGFLLAMPVVSLTTFVWLASPSIALLPSVSAAAIELPTRAEPTSVFLQTPDWIALGLSLLWSLGAVLMLLRQVGGWWLIADFERQPFQILPMAWQQKVTAMQQALGIARSVTVRLMDHSISPFTARFLRPVIWLPASLLTRIPSEQLEMLLAHELAHIARLDWLWNGLQAMIESLLFFHPGMWWLSRRIRQEREHACDDLAVAVCGNAIALAEALAALEHQRYPLPRYALAANGGSLMHRITRLLSGPAERPRWRTPASLLALFCTATLCASQFDLLSHKLVDLHIEESNEGALQPGGYREITANEVDKLRFYQAKMDANGKLSEYYEENSEAKPIDAEVRDWLTTVAQLSVPPLPPDLPALPTAPPPPPAAPDMSQATAFKALQQSAVNDARIAAQIGSPAQLDPALVQGEMNYPDERALTGDAEFSYVLTGPKGRAKVSVAGELKNGIWQLTSLDVEPAATP